MTTTQTGTDMTVCTQCEDEVATNGVWAQHLDPDDDGTGRMIGWSKSLFDQLCNDCLTDWQSDDMVGISEDYPL